MKKTDKTLVIFQVWIHGAWYAGLESRYHTEMAYGTFPDFKTIKNKISDKIFVMRRVRYFYWGTKKNWT